MYCMLCNADYQQYFDLDRKSVTLEKKFCQRLVETTMSEIRMRNEIYMPIFNAMGVLAECDPNSEYTPETYTIDLKLDVADQNKVEKCYDSFVIKNQKDLRVYFDDCSDFCGGYSLTQATEMFEGNFGKLYFLFRKLRQFNEVPTIKQVIFEQVNVLDEYDFSMISFEFFDAFLKNVRFEKFSINWDNLGIQLFAIASQAKNYYEACTSILGTITLVFGLILVKFM